MSSSINDTSEIPISQTLESLLTDIEFEIQDSNIQDMTASEVTREETSEVTNIQEDSNIQEMTANEVTNETSEVTNIQEESRAGEDALPEHSFISRTIYGKYGKMKGVKRITWTLIIGPYTFTKNKDYGEYAYFVCNDC